MSVRLSVRRLGFLFLLTVAKVVESPHEQAGESRHDELVADADKPIVGTLERIRESGAKHVSDVGQAEHGHPVHDGPVVERPKPEGHVDP